MHTLPLSYQMPSEPQYHGYSQTSDTIVDFPHRTATSPPVVSPRLEQLLNGIALDSMSSMPGKTRSLEETRSTMKEKTRLPPRQTKDEEAALDLEEEEQIGVEESMENRSLQSELVQSISVSIRRFIDQCVRQTRFSYTRLPDVSQEPQWIIRRVSLTPVMDHLNKRTGFNRAKIVAILLPAILFMALSMSIVRHYRSWSFESSSSWDGSANSSGPPSTSTLDVASPYYHLFDLSSLPKPAINSQLPIQLQKPRHLPLENGCLEQWFATGTLCSHNIGPQNSLDLVYLWVNGSDPIWQEQYSLTRASGLPERPTIAKRYTPEPPARHYRSQGSFKYALRSGVKAFTSKDKEDRRWMRKVHVLTADMPECFDETVKGRLGQIPDWLDKERIFGSSALERTALDPEHEGQGSIARSDEQPLLQWHFHSEVFRSPILPDVANCSGPGCSQSQLDEEWVEKVMPTFNSFNIENRMAWLNDLSEYRYVPEV
jgi:hypothetical protein